MARNIAILAWTLVSFCVGCGGSTSPKSTPPTTSDISYVPPKPETSTGLKSIDIEVPPPPKFVDQKAKGTEPAVTNDKPSSVEKKSTGIILPAGDVEAIGTKTPELPIR